MRIGSIDAIARAHPACAARGDGEASPEQASMTYRAIYAYAWDIAERGVPR